MVHILNSSDVIVHHQAKDDTQAEDRLLTDREVVHVDSRDVAAVDELDHRFIAIQSSSFHPPKSR